MRNTGDARPRYARHSATGLCLLLFAVVGSLGARVVWAQGPSAKAPGSVFDQLGQLGFHLQRAVGDPDGGTPAAFSFLHSAGSGTVYNYDFALLYTPKDRARLGSLHRTFQPSVEGKIASDDASSEDAWRFRLSCAQDQETLKDAENVIDTYTLASVEEESDRNFRTEKLLGELLWTPTIPAAFIGSPPRGRRSDFVWRPFLGLDYGATLRRGASAETSPTVLRLLLRTRAYLFLPGLRRALRTPEDVYLFADDKLYDLPVETHGRTPNLFVSGLVLGLSPNVSLGLTYKNGADSPDFQKIETLGGDVGVTF